MNTVNLRKVDLNLLIIFDALMLELNVTRAAERVFLSQPAMSNALRRLRELFNDPLLIRGASGMQATPRAQQLHQPIRKILNQIAITIEPPMEFIAAESNAEFGLGLNEFSETIVLPLFAPHFMSKAPNATLRSERLFGKDSAELLANGKLHALVTAPDYVTSSPQLVFESLFETPMVCLANPTYFNSSKISMSRYLKARHVYPSPIGSTTNVVETWLETLDKRRNIAITTQGYLAAAHIVANSDLLLTVPQKIAEQLKRLLKLRIMKLTTPPNLELVLVHHSLFHKDPQTQWFVSLIREFVKE